jgi:hypothetical protein
MALAVFRRLALQNRGIYSRLTSKLVFQKLKFWESLCTDLYIILTRLLPAPFRGSMTDFFCTVKSLRKYPDKRGFFARFLKPVPRSTSSLLHGRRRARGFLRHQ